MILFHASKTPGLKELQPHVSNHNHPLVYCSSKPENTLVYLSNAIEKYCKETGFSYNGVWHKWATYGFTPQGKFHLEEYYPDATKQTYEGVAGYLYSIHETENFVKMDEMPNVFVTTEKVEICDVTYIPNAYDAIIQAVKKGDIIFTPYEDNSPDKLAKIHRMIQKEYQQAEQHPEYRYFLKHHFQIDWAG